MRAGRGGERRAILLALLAAAAGALALAGYAGFLLLGEGAGSAAGASLAPLLLPLGLLGLSLAGLWAAITLLDQHFDDLERLRGALLVAAGTGGDARALEAAARNAGAEAEQLGAAAARLIEARGPARGEATLLAERLAAVVAATAEGLLVLTDSGLVSLVNAEARRRLRAGRVAVGTSVFAALARDPLIAAQQAARLAGRPVAAILTTVEGDRLEAVVVDLGGHDGLVLRLPGEGAAGSEASALEHDLGLHDAVPAMVAVEASTPLDRLSALVLDTETTGLDVATARIVSLGAVRLQGARIYPQANLDCLVRPDVPIPAASTAIHGIGDALVAQAPAIAELLPRLEALLGGGAVIGHSIGYDLTILEAEAVRCGRPWRSPPSLDTALLMAALEPGLKELNLEDIAGRLGVPVEGRHTALGDALVTAEIYLRLLPRLADAGVHTFAEAQAFAARARGLRGRQAAAGWTH
ncbi:MAG: 3'-5' exonuclease [Tistlia sp.]|uniref:PolC-type DNA polymerase III n=1 Tax=Tistlia sp. TaxID=3057121 RepID=UPI0034A446D7